MFTWKIEWMETATAQINGFDQVVLTAGWRCTAVDGNFSVTSYGSVGFPQPLVNGQFTPYDQLTEDVVLNWAWANGVDKTDVEAVLTSRLDDLRTPPTTVPPLPWGAST